MTRDEIFQRFESGEMDAAGTIEDLNDLLEQALSALTLAAHALEPGSVVGSQCWKVASHIRGEGE